MSTPHRWRDAIAAAVNRFHTFLGVYRTYRPFHSMRYSVRIAFGVAFRGLDF